MAIYNGESERLLVKVDIEKATKPNIVLSGGNRGWSFSTEELAN
ncbi:hypothetical protein [Aquibacillus halophilus]|nr:hypothetical protein [Aquibacillus halophilus]